MSKTKFRWGIMGCAGIVKRAVAHGSYEALLEDPRVDGVYIPLPNHLHREWTLRAAAAGKHVLCEKPIALNAAETAEMLAACRQAGVHLAEAFMYRHHSRYRQVKALVAPQADDFVRAARTEAAPLVPAVDPLRNMRVIDACLASARTNARVVLPEFTL